MKAIIIDIKQSKTKGIGYVYVIFAFLMIAIFLSCTLSLYYSNLLQAKNQERNIKAYYLALSGVNIATAALLQPGVGGVSDTLLHNRFSKDSGIMPVLNTSYALTDTLSLDGGSVDVKVSAFENAGGDRWIKVWCKATLTNSNISKSISMKFPYDDPDDRTWKQE